MKTVKTIQAGSVDVNKAGGTSLRGYVMDINYNGLVAILGQPTYIDGSGDGKVTKEWVIDFNGEIFTVYDWKTYDADYTMNELEKWNIGGHTNVAEFHVWLHEQIVGLNDKPSEEDKKKKKIEFTLGWYVEDAENNLKIGKERLFNDFKYELGWVAEDTFKASVKLDWYRRMNDSFKVNGELMVYADSLRKRIQNWKYERSTNDVKQLMSLWENEVEKDILKVVESLMK